MDDRGRLIFRVNLRRQNGGQNAGQKTVKKRANFCGPKRGTADGPKTVTKAQGNNHSLDAAFFREQLDGGCLLLLDGLDEVDGRTGRKSITRSSAGLRMSWLIATL